MASEEQIARAKRMGIPLPVTQLRESAINRQTVAPGNESMRDRLAALKRGANKSVVQDMIKKTSGGSKAGGFQGIPEPKVGRAPKGHPSNQVSQGKSVPIASFTPKREGGLDAIEAMYGGGDAGYPAPIDMRQQPSMNTTSQPELTVADGGGYGPSFDPAGIIARKRAEAKKSSEYMQFAMNPESQITESAPSTGQGQFDFKYMQQMMQEIAKNTISEVLNSYTEKNKDKLTYENYTKTEDDLQVIKTQNGKYFKLVPVRIVKG